MRTLIALLGLVLLFGLGAFRVDEGGITSARLRLAEHGARPQTSAALPRIAPYCVTNADGKKCAYYTLQSCQETAAVMDGSCEINPKPSTP